MALLVHVWSDVVCPWCYIGKRRFETAVQRFGEPVEIEWHSFQLDPRPLDPAARQLDYVSWLAKKFGFEASRAGATIDHVSSLARREGLDFQLRRAVPANTLAAHRILHLAKEEGLQGALKERLLRAHFSEGADVDDAVTLTRLGVEVGLAETALETTLASSAFEEEVRDDVNTARTLGISGVPFFVVGRYGVSGAQSADTFLGVLDRAFTEESEAPPADGAESGADGVCTPETC